MNFQFPEQDLSELNDEALHELAEQIRAAATNLEDQVPESEDAVAEVESLAEAYQAVVDEMTRREEAAQARAERAQNALSRIRPDEDGDDAGDAADANTGDDAGDAADANTGDDAAGSADEAGEMAATNETPDAGADASAAEASIHPPDTPAALPSGGQPADPAQEASVNEETTPAEAPATVPAGDPVGALAAARPAVVAPTRRSSTPDPRLRERYGVTGIFDAGTVDATTAGARIDKAELAKLMVRQHRHIQRLGSAVSFEPIVLATARAEFPEGNTLTQDHEHNLAIMESVINQARGLVASGGNCAPLAPIYDVFDVAEPMSPVEAFLPTLGAPRGGIRYIQPPAWTEAQAGVRITTEAEDAAGYTNEDPAGTTAPKPCVHLECRNIVECEVDAVSQCVTFGNLQYRTFPEQVEVFLDHLAVAFAQEKEISYLDAIEAASTAVTFTPAYGATRGFVFSMALAAHAYRKRNHMPIDARVDLLAPDSIIPLVKVDMVNDLHLGLGFLGVDGATVSMELLDRLNINVGWYYDYSTNYGSTNVFQQAQSAGQLNQFPAVFRTYMFAPGTFLRLDGGMLDVGIVRDSTRNSQNNLQMFAEEFVQVCKRGIESIRLDLTLCPSGIGPEPTANVLTCAS